MPFSFNFAWPLIYQLMSVLSSSPPIKMHRGPAFQAAQHLLNSIQRPTFDTKVAVATKSSPPLLEKQKDQ